MMTKLEANRRAADLRLAEVDLEMVGVMADILATASRDTAGLAIGGRLSEALRAADCAIVAAHALRSAVARSHELYRLSKL